MTGNCLRIFYKSFVVRNASPVNLREKDATLFSRAEKIKLPESGLFLLDSVFVTDLGIIYKNFSPLRENVICYESDFKNYRFKYLIKSFLKFKKYKYRGKKCIIIFDNYSGPNGFAHWICDGLTRLAEMNETLDEYTVIVPEYFKDQKLYSDTLNIFKISDTYYLPKDSVTFFKELHFPSPIGTTGNFHPENVRKLRDIVAKKFDLPEKAGNNIYISRAKATRRFIQNEKEVTDLLKKYDFTTVYLEDYPFAEQVRIFNGATNIISIHGAALTVLMFACKGASVMELRSSNDAVNNMYYTLANVCHLNYYYLNCESIERSKAGNNFDLEVDLQEFEIAVKQMINKRQ